MDPTKPTESTKQRLERYQEALDYLNDVRFARFSPPESKQHTADASNETTYIPGTKIAEINKEIMEGKIASAKKVIETWLEIDPANPILTSLLKKSYISPEEMLEAGESVLSRQTQLQDARNNLSLAEAQEAELTAQLKGGEEIAAGEAVGEVQETGQQFEDQQPSGQEGSGEEESGTSGQPSQRQAPSRVIMSRQLTNKERFGTKEAYAKYKEENKESRDERARKLWENRKKAGMTKEQYGTYKEENKEDRKKRAEDLWKRRALLKRPPPSGGGLWKSIADSRFGKWLADKVGATKLAKWIADKTGITQYGKWLADKTGLTYLNNALNAAKSWLGNVTGLTKFGNYLTGLRNSLGSWLGRTTGYTPLMNAIKQGLGSLRSWAGTQSMNALQAGLNLARSGLGNLITAARPLLAPIGTGATAIGGGIMWLGGAAAAIVTTALFWWVVAIVVVVGFSIWSIFDAYSECSRPGTVELTKSADKTTISEGENINYKINVVYKIKCAGATIDAIVEDKVPSNTTYVPASAKSTVPEFNGQFYSDISGPIGEIVNNTLVWRFTNLPANAPAKITFSITPNGTNTWVVNQASVKYSRKGAKEVTDSGFPPTQDNCSGKYSLKNPLGNFGDPECVFSKDDLLILLENQDPKNALFWFYNVVRCESGYNPNSWRDPNITPKTPDPAGAWGLYQMGRGRNGPYDRGDVPWQQQTINAVTYAKGIPSIGAYWACAR